MKPKSWQFSMILLLSGALLAFGSGTKDKVQLTYLGAVDATQPKSYWDLQEQLFEKANPDIDLVQVEFAGPREPEYTLMLYQTGKLPDIISAAGEIRKIPGALMEIPAEVKALLSDDIVQAFTDSNGHMDEMPTSQYMWCNVWYNKTIFDKYGLTPPTSWAEFEKVCKTLKANGVAPLVTGGPTTQWVTGIVVTQPLLSGMFFNLAGDYSYVKKLKSGQLKWNGPEVSRVLNWWKSLIDAGYYHEGSYSFTLDQMRDTFVDGKAAMVVEGAWLADVIKDRIKFDASWFAIPNEFKRNTTVIGGAGLSFNAKTKYPEAVVRYMKWYLSDNAFYRALIMKSGGVSTTKVPVPVDIGKLAQQEYDLTKQWGVKSILCLETQRGDNQMPSGFLTSLEKMTQNIFVGASVSAELDIVEKQFRDLLAQPTK